MKNYIKRKFAFWPINIYLEGIIWLRFYYELTFYADTSFFPIVKSYKTFANAAKHAKWVQSRFGHSPHYLVNTKVLQKYREYLAEQAIAELK